MRSFDRIENIVANGKGMNLRAFCLRLQGHRHGYVNT